MNNRFYLDMLWVLGVVVATGLGWLLVRKGATPDSRAAVENALRLAQPADVENLTVYPLVPSQGTQSSRPFQVRTLGQLRVLLPALQQMQRVEIDSTTFQPLLEATLVVRLAAGPAAAWHLRNRSLVFRLAASGKGEVAQLAQTNYFYQATALSRQLTQLRDSLARP